MAFSIKNTPIRIKIYEHEFVDFPVESLKISSIYSSVLNDKKTIPPDEAQRDKRPSAKQKIKI